MIRGSRGTDSAGGYSTRPPFSTAPPSPLLSGGRECYRGPPMNVPKDSRIGTASPDRWERAMKALLAASALLLAGAWIAVLAAGPALVRVMTSGRVPGILAVPSPLAETASPDLLLAMLTRALGLATLALAVPAAAWLGRRPLARRFPAGRFAEPLLSASILLGSSVVCFLALRNQGFEGSWYRLAEVMSFTAQPPYQHRILFVWVADALHALFPGWAPSRCYFVSQIPVILIAFVLMKRWVRLFVPPRVAVLSPLLLALMLIPTFGYFTFYDVGVTLFSTACLLLLFRRRLWAYLSVFLLGTLNHEVVLLMVPVFAVLYADAMPRGRYLEWILLQIAGYTLIRLLLFHFLPADAAWSGGKVWMNVNFLVNRPGPVAASAAAVLFWWTAAAAGIPFAPSRLRRCLILVPLLVGMAVLVGQINEPRLMNSLIPVVLALAMIGIMRSLGMSPPGAEAIRAGARS